MLRWTFEFELFVLPELFPLTGVAAKLFEVVGEDFAISFGYLYRWGLGGMFVWSIVGLVWGIALQAAIRPPYLVSRPPLACPFFLCPDVILGNDNPI